MTGRRRQFLAGAALLLLSPHGAEAAQLCSESIARQRLAELQATLMRPEAMAAMDSAKADFAADGDFDNLRNARTLAAARLYFKVEDRLDAGAVPDACLLLEQGRKLIDQVMTGQ
ncbi:hypothetical protein [Dongia sp. agr-C8]